MIDLFDEPVNQWACYNGKPMINLFDEPVNQWACFNGKPIVDLFDEPVDYLLVSLLQWQIIFDSKLQTYELVPTSNQQWACFNDTIIFGNKSIHELVPTPNLHSEPALMAPSVNAMTYLFTSPYSSVNPATSLHVQLVSLLQWHHSTSHSEPATIGISILQG